VGVCKSASLVPHICLSPQALSTAVEARHIVSDSQAQARSVASSRIVGQAQILAVAEEADRDSTACGVVAAADRGPSLRDVLNRVVACRTALLFPWGVLFAAPGGGRGLCPAAGPFLCLCFDLDLDLDLDLELHCPGPDSSTPWPRPQTQALAAAFLFAQGRSETDCLGEWMWATEAPCVGVLSLV
jgi:hypothetical protein